MREGFREVAALGSEERREEFRGDTVSGSVERRR